jgi:hypothetical protein
MSTANAFGLPPPLDVNLTIGGIVEQTTYSRIDYNNGVAQSIPSATVTAISFPTPYLSNNIPAPTDTSTTYTAPIGGYYNISYSICYASYPGIGTLQAWVKRNAANIRYASTSSSAFEASALTVGPPVSAITLGTDPCQLSGSCVTLLGLGETFQIQTYQNSGSSQDLSVTDGQTSIITIDFLHP